jgi:hypothetical protein
MKNKFLNRSLLGFAIVAVAFSACKKDDDSNGNGTTPPPAKKNELVYDGVKSDIKSSVMIDYGNYGGFNAYNFDIFLSTKDLVWNAQAEDFAGIGDLLYFELFTTDSTGLADGSYSQSNIDFGKPNTFETGFYIINFNTSNSSLDDMLEVNSGGLTSKRNGNEYEFVIDVTLDSGKKLTGYYKGTPVQSGFRMADPNDEKALPMAIHDIK